MLKQKLEDIVASQVPAMIEKSITN